jgi:endonuclease YncB( thermonuclease family)
MSIASEISRIQQAKADIKTAIETKGVTVPSSATIDTYDDYVSQISGGGGGGDTTTLEKLIDRRI